MISFSMKQHLFDPYYYQGLGLLSLISLFTMPISLEIIFAHRDLWFDSNHIWQNVCVQWCWELWMAFGIVGLTSWISTSLVPLPFWFLSFLYYQVVIG
jgi:hypothetical protein